MNYYNLLKEISTKGDIVETRGLRTKELTGVTLEVDSYNFFATPKYRPLEKVMEYLLAEWCWYLSGERNIKKILPYSKFWGSIRNKDNTANSNYGDLVFYRHNSRGITSFHWALDCLRSDIFTRKAIVLYNDRELFYQNNMDLICNQYQHFLVRDNKLDCFVGLRSSDAIFGLTYNIPWWSLVQQRMLLLLQQNHPKLELGKITAFISSAHIYENKWGLVSDILASEQERYFIKFLRIIPLLKTFEWYGENLHEYYSVEKVDK